MMMHNPELYQDNSTAQREDTIIFLEKYANKMKWNRSGDSIIDLGSGDGGITKNVLKKYIPCNYEKLVGCDKSEEMVNFSNMYHGDEKTNFFLLDIEEPIPLHLTGSYDHVFSFYMLHWCHNQKVVFSNIYNLLGDGGDCFLLFLGYMPIFDGFRVLSKHEKWQPFLKDIERFVSIYHESENPDDQLRKIMENIGFKNLEVKYVDASHIYLGEIHFKKAIAAINPFKIPSHLQEEFLDCYLETAWKTKIIQHVDNGVILKYKLMEVYGTK